MGLDNKKKKVFKVSMDLDADEKARELNPPQKKKRSRASFDIKQALKILGGLVAVAALLWLAGWYDIFSPPPPKFEPTDEAQRQQMTSQHDERMRRINERAP
jgi:hypothetical protein